MDLKEEIQKALKENNIIIGYRRSIKYIKTQKPRLVVIANNIPDNMRKEIEHNSKISGANLEMFNGSSVDLGVFCGKPFPISVIVIK